MTFAFPEELLVAASELIASRLGLFFPPERWHDLERAVRAAHGEAGGRSPEAWLRALLGTPWGRREKDLLAAHLTVGETYFFRDSEALAVLEQRVLPELIASRDLVVEPVRVWSAGCCTGEECYTLAMMLDRLLPRGTSDRWTVLGTDLNAYFIEKARRGVYREWSFRGAPDWIRDRYFHPTPDGSFQIIPDLRKGVTFAQLNLAEDVYPSPANGTDRMDIVFCRNVLMYFRQDVAGEVAMRLARSLRRDGWLAVAPAEAALLSGAELRSARLSNTTLFRRRGPEDEYSSVTSPALPPVDPHLEIFTPPSAPVAEPLMTLDPGPAGAPRRGAPLESLLPATGADELQFGVRQELSPPQASFEKAVALYESGRYADAVEELSSYLGAGEAIPLKSQALLLLVQGLSNLGRLSVALEWCERAISSERLSPTLHYLHATLLQELGRFEEAGRAFRHALYLDADFVLAHFALGHLAHQQGNPVEARRHYANALSLVKALSPGDELPLGEGMTAGALAQLLPSLVAV